MTLREFFDLLAANPAIIFAYFGFIPLAAIIAGVMGRGEGNQSPWKYLYSTLIYLVCVPGIFAVTLSVYLFLFEKRSIFDTDLYTQIIPLVSMAATLLIISKNVALDEIPGFDKMSGLIVMVLGVLTLMWILDKTRIFVFTYLPFQYVILILVGLLLVVRVGWKRLLRTS